MIHFFHQACIAEYMSTYMTGRNDGAYIRWQKSRRPDGATAPGH